MMLYPAVGLLSDIIAAVLLLSAVGKLIDRQRTAAALLDYGISERWSGPAARLLPSVELTVAAGLILRPLPAIFAVFATLLFSCFLAVAVRALASRKEMDCQCFGALTKERLGAGTMARLALLLLLATVVAGSDIVEVRLRGADLGGPGVWHSSEMVPTAMVAFGVVLAALLLGQALAALRQPGGGSQASDRTPT